MSRKSMFEYQGKQAAEIEEVEPP